MTRACRSLARCALALLLCVTAAQSAHAQQGPKAPLLVVFEPSAAALPQADIRAAIASVLAVPLLDAPNGVVDTLVIGVVDGGQVRLRYRPRSAVIERSLPPQSGTVSAIDIAMLAQNLVSDQTSAMLADAPPPQPQPAPPFAAPPPPTLEPADLVPQPPVPRARYGALQLHLLLQAALFGNVSLHPSLPSGASEPSIGAALRVEGELSRHLMLGMSVGYSLWSGSRGELDTLQIGNTQFTDLQLSLRPRFELDDAELYLAIGVGPSVLADIDLGSGARIPDLGLVATAQLGVLYWFNPRIGVLLKLLGIAYRYASASGTGYSPDERPWTLDELLPAGSIAAAVGF